MSNTSAYQYVVDSKSQSLNRYAVKHSNGMDYDPSEAGYHYGLLDDGGSGKCFCFYCPTHCSYISHSDELMKREYDRRKRNTDEYNETIGYTVSTPNDAINHQNDSNRNRDLENLITNRTIFIDCLNSTMLSRCVQVKFSMNNFEANNAPLLVQLEFSIDLRKVDEFFTKNIDSFLIRPSIGLVHSDDNEG